MSILGQIGNAVLLSLQHVVETASVQPGMFFGMTGVVGGAERTATGVAE